jgi:hypothetical protein
MPDLHCFTSFTFSYLDRARVLAQTIKKYHPNWELWACIADKEPLDFKVDLHANGFEHVVRIGELDIPRVEQWIFGHDLVELCTAVKGAMLCHMLKSGARKVIYLDPDIALFGSLELVPELLDHHSIILTPHQLEPEQDQLAIWDNEIGSLKHGIYNLGFLAVRACNEGIRFAEWWRARLLEFCHADIANGLFTDQRWCDFVPVFFENTHILRDPGFNVASWNLSKRPLCIDQTGEIRAGEHLLRFFHFTKVDSVGQQMLERYFGGSYEVFELLRWYRERLEASKVVGLPKGWWAFGRYENHTPISREERLLYRDRRDLQKAFPRPFESGVGTYQAWFAAERARA